MIICLNSEKNYITLKKIIKKMSPLHDINKMVTVSIIKR